MHRWWIWKRTAAGAKTADLEASFVPIQPSVVVRPAMVKGHTAAAVGNAIESVITVSPGAASAEHVARTGGVTTEAIGVPRRVPVHADQVVGIAILDQVI